MLVKYNFVHLNKVAKRLEQKFMLVEYNEFSVKRNADVYKLFRARGYYLNHISSICSSVRRLRNNCIRQKCNQCEHKADASCSQIHNGWKKVYAKFDCPFAYCTSP